jgi:hypothetical protein
MGKIEQAVEAGLSYIQTQQQADGGFTSYSSPSAQSFRSAKTYQTTFAPALMLSALSSSDGPAAAAIRQQLASWLLEQASSQWSFNYWSSRSPEREKQPYPDDLDDTFCALSALYLHDPTLVDGTVLAQAVKLLLATESRVGGPYRTWLVPTSADRAWQDVDLAVNANIAYFLSLAARPLPNLTSFIDEAISSDELTSPYYPSSYAVVYYIARGYGGKRRQTLLGLVRTMLAAADSALDIALCVSSISNLGVSARQGDINKLLAGQSSDGSWPAAAFCLDPTVGGKARYSGSAALTTAFAVEALERWRARGHQESKPALFSRTAHVADDGPIGKTLQLVEKQSADLPHELQASLRHTTRALTTSSNGSEITALATRFNDSLAKPLTGAPTHRFLTKLNAANLYGWTAYTIYDDFLDGEGQPKLLSTANAALRYSLANWQAAMPDNKMFAKLIAKTFDTIDGANAWELEHCRFVVMHDHIMIADPPDYGDLSKLAERSLGHSLGPIAVLAHAGIDIGSDSIRQLQQAFKHYLIARQLNDDCHDWMDDLRSGQITYVVGRLISELQVRPGSHTIASLRKRARQQFWHITLPALCDEMLEHVRRGQAAIRQVAELQQANVLSELLRKLEASIAKTRTEQEQSLAFLKQYGSPATQ